MYENQEDDQVGPSLSVGSLPVVLLVSVLKDLEMVTQLAMG